MVGNCIIGMEVFNYLLSGFKSFAIFFLLLQHLVFVSTLFFLDEIKSFFNKIVEVFWLLIDCPSVLYLMRFKAEHVLFKKSIDLCVAIDFCTHFFDFNGDRSIKIILELTTFLNVGCNSLYFGFDLSESLEMLVGGGNNSFRDDLDESQGDAPVFSCHIVTYFFSVDVKQANLDALNYFLLDFSFPTLVCFYFFFDLLDFLSLIFLNPFQLFGNVHQKKFLVLRVLSQIAEEGVSDSREVLLETFKKLPHPKILIFDDNPFSYF